jgi:prepilin-type N-terminal cleavage/methylation domain-containing protein
VSPCPRAGTLRVGQRGFTMLELAIAMVVMGLLIVLGAYGPPWLNERLAQDNAGQRMEESAQALLAFARTHHRLPCADGNGNGVEGPGCPAVGQLPYQTLLLAGPTLDRAHLPVVYAVYRNAGTPTLDADLARLIDRARKFDDPPDALNVYDFCRALDNALAATRSANFASTSTRFDGPGGCAAGELDNQAFVLMGAGTEDEDGSGNRADEDNDTAPATCFSSPIRGRDHRYDDIVLSVGFADLIGEVCP